MSTGLKTLIAVLLLAALGGGAYRWWPQRPLPRVVASAPAPLPTPEPVAAQAVPEPAIRHPIEAIAAEAGERPAAAATDSAMTAALVDLLGRKEALGFLQLDAFVRHAVATVDNLGRAQASARLWPVVPTPGRFATSAGTGGGEVAAGPVLAAANAERYTPFVRFATAIDAGKATAVYVRFYPLLQAAYEALGYPRKYFNDRVVEVIDLLLQTPEPAVPIRLKVTEVKGPLAGARASSQPPSYEFADAELEARPAGQKILMRMGSANQRALKAKLREFRARIARP